MVFFQTKDGAAENWLLLKSRIRLNAHAQLNISASSAAPSCGPCHEFIICDCVPRSYRQGAKGSYKLQAASSNLVSCAYQATVLANLCSFRRLRELAAYTQICVVVPLRTFIRRTPATLAM